LYKHVCIYFQKKEYFYRILIRNSSCQRRAIWWDGQEFEEAQKIFCGSGKHFDMVQIFT